MTWTTNVIFYMGMFDAVVIMAGGLLASFVVLMGWDAQKMWDRIFPAGGILILSNIAAAIVLAATRYLVG